jgi:hypothetical protein
MMNVRVVWMAVRKRFVIVGVRMGLPRGIIGPVGVLVMDVMGVRMLM